jgi:cytochrome c556
MASPTQIDELPRRMLRAAMLVGDGDLTNDQIAAEVGVSRSTITKWKRREDFRAEVERFQTDVRDLVLQEGIARKEIRIMALNDSVERIKQIKQERALDPAMQNIPGGRTGLMKRTVKTLGAGASALIIEEGKFDAALHIQFLALLEQARKEMEEFENPEPKENLSKRPSNVKLIFAEPTPEQLFPPDIDVDAELRRLRYSVDKPSM